MLYVAVFCYTMQLITIKLCIKLQNPKSKVSQVVAEKSLTEKMSIGII